MRVTNFFKFPSHTQKYEIRLCQYQDVNRGIKLLEYLY